MRFKCMLLFFTLAIATAQAQPPSNQSVYFGVSLDAVTDFQTGIFAPVPTVQVGGEVSQGLELRASLGTILLISFLQSDVLYTSPINADSRFYVGGGADVLFTTVFGGGALFGVHGTFGADYTLTPTTHVFGELQPLFMYDVVILRGRIGISVYF